MRLSIAAALLVCSTPCFAQTPDIITDWLEISLTQEACNSIAKTTFHKNGLERIELIGDSTFAESKAKKIQAAIRCIERKKIAVFFVAGSYTGDLNIIDPLIKKLTADFRKDLPAPPQTHLMFFDFEWPELAPEATKYLEPIKQNAKPDSRIEIIGYCDTAERDPDKLSLARAQDIEKRLRALGLPQGVRITVKAGGAAETNVKTGPNAREPQNRVATISIQ